MEYITFCSSFFCHCLLDILVSVRVVIAWSCRKETVNRYFDQTFLVTGLWICGTLCLKTSYLLQLSTVWRDDLTVTVCIYVTVITVKTSNFKDQSTCLLASPWLHHYDDDKLLRNIRGSVDGRRIVGPAGLGNTAVVVAVVLVADWVIRRQSAANRRQAGQCLWEQLGVVTLSHQSILWQSVSRKTPKRMDSKTKCGRNLHYVPSRLKSVAALPCEIRMFSLQLYSKVVRFKSFNTVQNGLFTVKSTRCLLRNTIHVDGAVDWDWDRDWTGSIRYVRC